MPYLYLPVDACEAFESAFGLTWNEKNNIYPVDAAKRQELSNANPQFTFRLGNDKLSEPSVEITLPYASFDQIANKPLAPRDGYPYFPIKRGNDSQTTLGRAFLQEAYAASSVTIRYMLMESFQIPHRRLRQQELHHRTSSLRRKRPAQHRLNPVECDRIFAHW